MFMEFPTNKAMLMLVSILRLGKSPLIHHPIDTDTFDRMALCLNVSSMPQHFKSHTLPTHEIKGFHRFLVSHGHHAKFRDCLLHLRSPQMTACASWMLHCWEASMPWEPEDV